MEYHITITLDYALKKMRDIYEFKSSETILVNEASILVEMVENKQFSSKFINELSTTLSCLHQTKVGLDYS